MNIITKNKEWAECRKTLKEAIAFILGIDITHFIWNYLAPKFFYFLPAIWMHIHFLQFLALVLTFRFVRNLAIRNHLFTSDTEDKVNEHA